MNMQESSEPVSYINSGHADAIFECFGIEQRFFFYCVQMPCDTQISLYLDEKLAAL